MPSVSVLIKPASGNCNMRCEYCFYRDEMSSRETAETGMMSEETLKNVIRRTLPRAQGLASYAFQGGEPTLRGIPFYEAVLRFQKQYNRNGVRVQNALQTNGVLLDDEWCSFLKKNGFLVGVSLDGIPETHDRYRKISGGPSFEDARRGIGLLEKHSVPFNILTVVTAEVAERIGEIYDYYAREGFDWMQFIPCLDPLSLERGAPRYQLTAEAYGRFLVRLFDLWFRDLKNGKIRSVRTFDNWAGILAGYPPESCDQVGTCSVQYVAEADGSVYPCDFYALDEYRLGNFNTDRLDRIDAVRDGIGFISKSRNRDEACISCPYHALCRGGCRRHRDAEGKNRFCESYRFFFGSRLDQLKEATGILFR